MYICPLCSVLRDYWFALWSECKGNPLFFLGALLNRGGDKSSGILGSKLYRDEFR